MKEPSILTEHVFYYKPESSALSRRRIERIMLQTVEDFLKSLGFEIVTTIPQGRLHGILIRDKETIRVFFQYYQTCKNVYKSFQVYVDDKKSNISALRKLY